VTEPSPFVQQAVADTVATQPSGVIEHQPARLEAEASPVTIEYQGQTYAMPPSLDDADGDVVDAIDDQKISYALRALLGDAQWKRFKKTKPKARDYDGLFDVYAKRIGLESTGE
jgi:hypothetical protein